MIFTLPEELLSLIFENLTNNQDQISTQLVCYSWHGPAKRAFYEKVAIQELHGDADHHNKLTKFIRSMVLSSVYSGSSRIPSAGQYVKSLLIDFEIVLEPKFMPTVADYQLLAAAIPNLEELNFPVNMFWNYFMDANLDRYWSKLKKIPAFRLTPTTPKYQMDRFLFFQSSLTYLEIQYFYGGHTQQLEEFTQMIRLFTNLEKIKISSNTLTFAQMIPILVACPNITELKMITTANTPTTDDNNDAPQLPIIPKLRHLDLNVGRIAPQLVQIITQKLPALQKLVLQHQQVVSAGEMHHLMRYITTKLSQSSIQLFTSTNDSITLSKQILLPTCCGPAVAVNIGYDSRSSFTTKIPDLSYHHQQSTKYLSIRYQGSISSQIQSQDLPHMQLLKSHGAHIQQLKLQLPLSLYQAEKSNLLPEEESCIQTILMHYCPNVSVLHISQCYFTINNYGEQGHLTKLTLEKSLIASTSLYHLSHQCAYLNYLVLDQCEFNGLVDMSKTKFKKLSIITAAAGKKDDMEITIFEQSLNRTAQYYYTSLSKKITLMGHQEKKDTGTPQKKQIEIKCWSMDQLRFNHIPIILN